MKDVVFIGKTSSGKTTLCQKLDEQELKYRKTQSVEIYENAIDTPGEYIENRNLYNALITTAVDAKVIALVFDCTQEENYIAPGLATMFQRNVIGIITKVAEGTKEQIDYACEQLIAGGVEKIFKVDAFKGVGIDQLRDYLESIA